METLNILEFSGLPIFRQLQLEEALLRLSDAHFLILNDGSPPAVVMGISGKVDELVFESRRKSLGLALMRRYSGGGTVVVDESTFFVSLILGKVALPVSPYPKEIMQWTEALYKPTLGNAFALRENDYVLGERKCGGNAQSITRRRIVHHSTFLWDYSETAMATLKQPRKAPEYRLGRGHSAFLCCLKEYLPTRETLFHGIKAALAERFDLKEGVPDFRLLDLPHRKVTELIEENGGRACGIQRVHSAFHGNAKTIV